MGSGVSVSGMSAEEVGEHIAQLGQGFEKYRAVFVENGIDGNMLMQTDESLLENDLRELGISLAMHRRKIIDSVNELKGQTQAPFGQVLESEPKKPQRNDLTQEQQMQMMLQLQQQQFQQQQEMEQKRYQQEEERRKKEAREAEERIQKEIVLYHPGPFRNDKYHCCNSSRSHPGCRKDQRQNMAHHYEPFRPFGLLGSKGWGCCGQQSSSAPGCTPGALAHVDQGGLSVKSVLGMGMKYIGVE